MEERYGTQNVELHCYSPPPQSNKKGEITRERVIILEGDIHSFEFEWRLPNVKL